MLGWKIKQGKEIVTDGKGEAPGGKDWTDTRERAFQGERQVQCVQRPGGALGAFAIPGLGRAGQECRIMNQGRGENPAPLHQLNTEH